MSNSPHSQGQIAGEGAFDACVMCDKKAALRCPTCGSWYCGHECYREDWPQHKILCDTLKGDFSDDKRPPNHVRAIMFPSHASRPTFIWLNKEDMEIEVCRALGIDEEGRARGELYTSPNTINNIRREYSSDISICTFSVISIKNNINQSMLALAKPGHMKIYYGPIIFCSFSAATSGGSRLPCVDTTLRDFRDLLDFYHQSEENPCIVNPRRFPLAEYGCAEHEVDYWPAVKVNCEGDITRLSPFCGESNGLDLVENVLVLSDQVKDKRAPCALPRFAGLPWSMQTCSGTNSTLGTLSLHNYGGRVFAPGPLYNSVEGVPKVLTTTYCGTIIVMHEKGAPIYHSHVLCFYDFVEVQLRQITMKSSEKLGPGLHRIFTTQEQLEEHITKERFLEYWQNWIMEKMKYSEHRLEYDDIRSPYAFEELGADQRDLEAAMRILDVHDEKDHEKALAEAKRDLGIE